MRRFVITEKYRPWLWKDDEMIYHDRDFMVVMARIIAGSDRMALHGFILFDKSFFEDYTETQINDIARLNHSAHHNGLPLCKNRRIFAPYIPQELDNYERIIVFMQEIRTNIINAVDKRVSSKYDILMNKIGNYTKELRQSGKEL